MGGSNYGKLQNQRARKRVLADGQGATRRRPSHRTNSPRHKRAFRDLRRQRAHRDGDGVGR